MAWASTVAGDSGGAIRQALVLVAELRGQEEPYWTAVAVLTVGYIEKAVGPYDDALRHLSEARDQAERFGYAWLATWSRVQLGTLAMARGRLDDAAALLDEGLAASLAVYSTRT
jgi:tetratricopeptide (TPR) repeat protein